MQVTQVTSLDIRGSTGGPSLGQAVQDKGSLSGTILQSLPGGRIVVETPSGRFSLVLSESARSGQTITFSYSNGQLQASLGPPPAESPVLAALTRPSLEKALENLGVARTESTLTLARALLRAGFPLSGEVLQSLESLLGPVPSDQEDALTFLLSRGAPLSRALLEQLVGARPDAMARLVDALAGFRETLINLIPDGTSKRRFQEMLIRLIGTPVSVGADAEVIGEHFERFLQNSGFDLERILAQIFGKGAGKSFSAADGALLAGQTLKTDLLLLREFLNQALLRDPGSPIAHRLRELLGLVEGALNATEFMQMSAMPGPSRETALPLALFVPIMLDEQTSTLLLVVEREPQGGKGRGEDRLQLTLQLDLTQLGPLRIILGVQERRVDIRLEVTDEETRGYVALNSEDLARRLEAAGYRVDGILAAIGRNLEWPRAIVEAALKGRSTREIQGFDVRA